MKKAMIVECGGNRVSMLAARWAASGYDPVVDGVATMYSSSAGAWACAYLLSGRISQTRSIWLAMTDKGMLHPFNLVTSGTLARVSDVLQVSQALVPLDFAEIDDWPVQVVVTIFREEDGQPEYVPLTSKNAKELLAVTIAVPPISERCYFHGESYCDGGGADPLPVRKAIMDGHTEISVYATREKEYRIPTYEYVLASIPWPGISWGVRKAFAERLERHRDAIKLIQDPPEGVRIHSYHPEVQPPCTRLERDPQRVLHAWELGRKQGEEDLKLSKSS